MHIKYSNGESEFILDPDDRELVIVANKEISGLNESQKELVKSIIHYKLDNCIQGNHPNPNLPIMIGKSLSSLLCQESTNFILNMMQNPDHIVISLNTLRKENLIDDKTYEFTKELTLIYGHELKNMVLTIERPYDWIRISSDVLVDETGVTFDSRIWRRDGEIFNFNVPLLDSVGLADHFIRHVFDAIEQVDKEIVLDLSEDRIVKLEERLAELKELRSMVQSEIEKVEDSDESKPIIE